MSDLLLPIGVSFDRAPEPVLLTGDNQIRYCNPAAATLFPSLEPGSPIPTGLDALEADSSTVFTAGGRSWSVLAWSWEAGLLIRLTPLDAETLFPDHRLPVLSQKLRGPMTALISAERLVEHTLTADQQHQARRYLARSNRAQLRMLRMLRSLELAALADGKPPYDFYPQLLDLKGLCQDALRQMEALVQAAGCSIAFQAASGNLLAYCDDNLMEILLYHLVSNAINATGPGGHLLLRLECRKKQLLLSVEDDGPGLTPQQLAALFQPAQQSSSLREAGSRGLGLGITVCRKIARLHEGSVLFANRPGRGLRATVSLPLAKPNPVLPICSPRMVDSSNGVSLVLRELSDVLPEECFLPEDL